MLPDVLRQCQGATCGIASDVLGGRQQGRHGVGRLDLLI